MDSKNIPLQKLLASVKLPSIPDVAVTLIRTLDDEDFHLNKIVQLIEKDPGITATVIKHANSARYGLSNKVRSVEEAIRMLGFSNVRAIALGASVSGVFPADAGIDRTQFWKWSETAGELAHKLAGKARLDATSAWLIGFTMRIGEILIAQYDSVMASAIEAGNLSPGTRWKREIEALGATEGQIVAVLAGMWNFPEDVVSGLRASGNPLNDEWPFSALSAVAYTGGLLADAIVNGVNDSGVLLDSVVDWNVADEIGLTRAQVQEVITSQLGNAD